MKKALLLRNRTVFMLYLDLGLGGIQTKIISLANSLVNQGVDCWLFLKEKPTFSRHLLVSKGVRLIIMPRLKLCGKNIFGSWRLALIVVFLAKLLKPKTFFVSMHNLSTWLINFLYYLDRKSVTNVVISEDTYPSLEVNYEKSDRFVRYISKTYNKAKRVIAVSKSAFDDLKDNFKVTSPPLIHIPNWVNFNNVKSPRKSGRDIDVVYGGRLTQQKRPKLLAKLFYLLLKKRPGLNICVYGDGDQKQLFLKELKRLNIEKKIKCFSPIKSFDKVLCKSKILVFTSLYEGLPFTGIEAMKAGAVNACLNVPGLKDLVIRNETGVLEKSVPRLANQILLFLKKPKQLTALRQNAYYYAKDHFSEKNEKELIKIMLE